MHTTLTIKQVQHHSKTTFLVRLESGLNPGPAIEACLTPAHSEARALVTKLPDTARLNNPRLIRNYYWIFARMLLWTHNLRHLLMSLQAFYTE